jgi:hypothetical protein
MKWIGKEKGAEGIPGIPGRDLTKEEVKKFGRDFLLGTGLYVEAKKANPKGKGD